MKAFFVGLLFLIAIMAVAGLGIVLSPFLAVFTVSLQMVIGLIVVVFVVWLLGKLIIFIWDKLSSNDKKKI